MTKGENIYKRKDGRWEGRYKKGYDANRKIKYGYCYGRSYRETKEKLNYAKANLVLRHPAVPQASRGKTFDDYCMQWLRISKNRLKKSTLAKYHSMLQKHIRPRLGAYTPAELNSDIIADFSDELSELKHLASKTVRDILSFVHKIIVYIQSDTGNALLFIAISYPKTERKKLRILSIEEQQYFTHYLLQESDIYKFSIVLALFTGLRIGEVCALQWKDISLETGIMTVSKTVQRIQNPDGGSSSKTILLLGTPKTSASVRTIPLAEGIIKLCQIFRSDDSEAFVLTGTRHFMEPRGLQRKLKKYTTELDLSGIHFHTLRHTFATRCIEAGCDMKTLSEILGHSSISTTMNRYVHPDLNLKRENISKLEQAGFLRRQ